MKGHRPSSGATPVHSSVETVIEFARAENRMCPQPQRWNELWAPRARASPYSRLDRTRRSHLEIKHVLYALLGAMPPTTDGAFLKALFDVCKRTSNPRKSLPETLGSRETPPACASLTLRSASLPLSFLFSPLRSSRSFPLYSGPADTRTQPVIPSSARTTDKLCSLFVRGLFADRGG